MDDVVLLAICQISQEADPNTSNQDADSEDEEDVVTSDWYEGYMAGVLREHQRKDPDILPIVKWIEAYIDPASDVL